jgi:hypothetical protein
MSQHKYLRAYMAGIVAPTMFLLVVLTAFIIARLVYRIPIPIERTIVFPMALIPNLWGVWNMLYVRLQTRRFVPIGIHGPLLLVLLIVPAGLVLGRLLDLRLPSPNLAALGIPAALVAYYLLWKYVVNFLNELLGIA